MNKSITRAVKWMAIVTLMAGCVMHSPVIRSASAKAERASNAIWAHGQLYDTIATPAFFDDPPIHSTDVIYSFDGSGLAGQRSVAEAAPGDPDYNGGRWRVMAVVFTDLGLMVLDSEPDGVIDAEIMDATDVLAYAAAGLIEITDTGVRFECPLLPRRARQ